MWVTCPACGCLVTDRDTHLAWHGTLPPGQDARLRWGHPRDWPDTPGAPTEEIPLEPPTPITDLLAPQPAVVDPPTDPPEEEAP